MERICFAIKLRINDSKCGIMSNTKQELPQQLAKYSVINDVNSYKYLRVEMGNKVNVEKCMTRIIKQIKKSIMQLKKEETSSWNLINRINSDIISKLRYVFLVIP